jgi:hypothetical protein
MAFWVVALVYLAFTVAYELLRPKQKFDKPAPGSLGDFGVPTIGEGRPIPIVWGTCKLQGPMVTWYGDLSVVAMKKKVKTGLFSSEKVTTGYKYSLGMQLVFCSGDLDSIVQILIDEKAPNQSQAVVGDKIQITLDSPDLFGGDESEGGVQGTVDFYKGTADQTPNDYLETAIGDDLPAWRNIAYAVFRGVYLGTSAYIKNIAAVVKRCPNGLGLTDGDHDISGDANPACMIHELLTRPLSQNGLGIPEGLLDLDAFRQVGADLADEGLGISLTQDRATGAKELVLEILRHIDAMLYVEPSSGLLTFKLIRFDYAVGGLPVLDTDNCTVKSYSRPSWRELKNVVRLTYIDRADGFVEKTVQAQELAAIDANGGEVAVQDLQMRGLSNATNAQLAVSRGLMALAYPLATLVIEADRTAWQFRPGTVFKLNWDPLGISGLVCRVIRVKGGNLTAGRIELDALEDVFAIEWTAYSAPPASGWVSPLSNVPAVTDRAIFQAPYEAAEEYGGEGPTVKVCMAMAARGAPGISTGYRVYPKEAGGSGWNPATDVPFFTPVGTLDGAIDETTTSIDVTLGPDIENIETIGDPDFAAGNNVLWIQDGDGTGPEEFIAFKTVTPASGKIVLTNLARGVLDTCPTAFASGRRVWFVSYGAQGVLADAPQVAPTATFRLQAYNNQSEYSFALSPERSLAIYSAPGRADRPYCPTDLRFNGASYPASISGELTVSYEYRDRLGDWDYSDSGMTAAAEAGTSYRIKVYGELGTLVHTENTTAKTWTYLEADEIAESGLGRLNNHLRVTVETIRDTTIYAFRMLDWEFDRV